MRTKPRRAVSLVAAIGAVCLAVGLGTPASAADPVPAPGTLTGDALAELRAALDPEPVPPPLTGQAARDLAEKDRKARAAWNEMQGQRAADVGTMCIPELCGVPANDSVTNVVQYPQERSYWCGPSALKTAVKIYDNTRNNWPTLGDAYEVTGGYHLVGHPNANIFHWFTIYGYSNYGEGTNYADPAGQSTAVSWGMNVPRYSNMSSNMIVVIMGGRGYVW